MHLPMETNSYDFWLTGIDMHWLPVMDEVWVLMDDDWEESMGVNAEINYAKDHGLPLRFINPITKEVI